ncbi:MAG: hypothetical protein ACRD2B_03830 [Terriglobia bacterium]
MVPSAGVIGLGEGECGALSTVNGGPLHAGDRVALHVSVADEMLEKARKRRQPAANGQGLGLLDFAHDALRGNHRPVIYLVQFLVGLDIQRPHAVPHVEPVSSVLRSERGRMCFGAH